METYEAKVTRDGKWWAIEVPALPGVFAQAAKLAQAREETVGAIAAMLEVDEDTFDVTLDVELDKKVAVAVAAARTARERAEEATHEASSSARDAALLLTQDEDLSYREAAAVLGISHQRVGQLVAKR